MTALIKIMSYLDAETLRKTFYKAGNFAGDYHGVKLIEDEKKEQEDWVLPFDEEEEDYLQIGMEYKKGDCKWLERLVTAAQIATVDNIELFKRKLVESSDQIASLEADLATLDHEKFKA